MIDILVFTIVAAIMLAVSLRGAQRGETFLVADRAVGFVPLVATLVMTEFNTATLLAFSAVGYIVGPRAIGLSAVFLVGLAWYTIAVARKWKQFNGVSVAGWFSHRYGVGLGRFAVVILLIAMLGFSATYVKSLTLIVAPMLGDLEPWTLSAVLCLALAGVTMSGGLASVVRLDVFGFALACLLFPLLLAMGYFQHGAAVAWTDAFQGEPFTADYWLRWDDPKLPWHFVLSLVVLTCITYICSPWYGQKIFAARSERVAVMAVGVASVIVFLLYASVQLAASLFPGTVAGLADAQLAVPAMLDQWLPIGLRGLAYAVLFAVATTTLAGVWSAMVGMLVSDFGGKWSENVAAQRGLTLLLAICSWLGANLLVDDILNRLILANIPIAALSFALIGGFHWKKTSTAGAWSSVIVGLVWGVFCFAYWGDAGGYTWYWTIYGAPLIFATGVIVSVTTPDEVTEPNNMAGDVVQLGPNSIEGKG